MGTRHLQVFADTKINHIHIISANAGKSKKNRGLEALFNLAKSINNSQIGENHATYFGDMCGGKDDGDLQVLYSALGTEGEEETAGGESIIRSTKGNQSETGREEAEETTECELRGWRSARKTGLL